MLNGKVHRLFTQHSWIRSVPQQFEVFRDPGTIAFDKTDPAGQDGALCSVLTTLCDCMRNSHFER